MTENGGNNGRTGEPLDLSVREALSGFIMVLGTARELDELLPIQALQILLLIARREAVTAKELSDLTGLSQSSISRNTALLGHVHRSKERPGLGLVEAVEDPEERRRKLYFLTKKGVLVVNRLLQALNTGNLQVSPFSARTAQHYVDGVVSNLSRRQDS